MDREIFYKGSRISLISVSVAMFICSHGSTDNDYRNALSVASFSLLLITYASFEIGSSICSFFSNSRDNKKNKKNMDNVYRAITTNTNDEILEFPTPHNNL